MELRHYRYFLAAAEELNISKASRRLNVSQPAMSRLIRDLDAARVKVDAAAAACRASQSWVDWCTGSATSGEARP